MKVFLSYSRDDRFFAELISNRLKAVGHVVWIDFEGIPGGVNWTEGIEKAIRDADWMIVLLSPQSTESRWVRSETLLALSLQKPILPILIKQADLPLELMHIQFLDATKDLDDAINRTLAQLPTLESERTNKSPASPETLERIHSEVVDAPPPDRIFIAYARPQRLLARELAGILHDGGKAVFYDAHIRAGARWRKIIQAALEDATHIVVIWTVEARDSDEVDREVSYALSQGIYTIPILSKDIPKLPYHLHGLQYLVLEDSLAMIRQELLDAIDQSATGKDGIWQ